MTRELAIKKHRELWHWIASETRRLKCGISKNMNPDIQIHQPVNCCWCCESVLYFNERSGRWGIDCSKCPIDWGNPIGCEGSFESPYNRWVHMPAEEWEACADLADKIAELPEREV